MSIHNWSEDLCPTLAQNNTNIERIILQFAALNDDQVILLSKALMDNTHVNYLQLNRNNIGVKGTRAIANLLLRNETIETVDLSHNVIGNDGAIALSSCLPKFRNLRKLYLQNCKIGDAGVVALSKAAEKSTIIETIDLRYNMARESGSKAAEEMNERNEEITADDIVETGSFVVERAEELKRNISEGSCSLKLLVFFGATAMIAASTVGFLYDLLNWHWFSGIFQLYTIFLGFLMILLEYGREIRFFVQREKNLYKYAMFLKFIYGRGVLYFFAGTLQISLVNQVDDIIGGFVCFVGVVHILAGYNISRKQRAQRREVESDRYNRRRIPLV